MKLTDKYW